MFLCSAEEVDYVDPWTTPYDLRLAQLVRRSVRVAYLYERPDTSTFRYRVLNMVQVINALSDDLSASWFCLDDGGGLERVVDLADVLVVARMRYSHELSWLITRAKRRGTTVIFDVDDLVFDARNVHLLVDTLALGLSHPIWDFWFAYIGRMGATLQLCDRSIVTNEYLAERIRDFRPGSDVRVVPNFLNAAQIELSRRLMDDKRRYGFASGPSLHIGYFSGSPTHNRDFEIVSDTLARLLDTDPRLRLRLVGFLDERGPLQRHAQRIERQPLRDFLNLQQLIGPVELNIAPLRENAFTNCKSELKYFEAAITGTLTVATPTYSFRKAIQHGSNGFLAESYSWQECFREAFAMLEDRAVYAEMAERAFLDASTRYAWTDQLPAIQVALLAGEAGDRASCRRTAT